MSDVQRNILVIESERRGRRTSFWGGITKRTIAPSGLSSLLDRAWSFDLP